MKFSSQSVVSETKKQNDTANITAARPSGTPSRRGLAVSAAFFVFSLAVLIVGALCTAFAEWYTTTISAFFRAELALLTAPFPFSLS